MIFNFSSFFLLNSNKTNRILKENLNASKIVRQFFANVKNFGKRSTPKKKREKGRKRKLRNFCTTLTKSGGKQEG